MPTEFNQYSTAKPFLGTAASIAWLNDELEALRIAAYQFYEMVYWTVPETFKLVARGEEDRPIYIPSGRVIVETLHRYMANGLQVIVDPAFGDANQQLLAQQVWTDVSARERFYSKFNMNKRYGIMRGDWAFHFYADPTRPETTRISIFPIDPASLFPIYNEENLDEIIGWHVVEQFVADGSNPRLETGKAYMKRLTYRKTTGKGGPSPIEVTDTIFETDAWGGPNMDEKAMYEVQPAHTLPSPIDSLPIYHIPNFAGPNDLWGSSEMRGIETIMQGLNQNVSDEDLTLAMDGLGVYATNAGEPVDDTGQPAGWGIGPARVVEVPADAFFNRVTGVTGVTPYQEHINYLHAILNETMGQPAVARGQVDVTVAESGIALLIQMGPLLAVAEEKERVVTDKMQNMMFDYAKWQIAYEGTQFNSMLEATRFKIVYGDKIPKNKQQEFDNLMAMAGTVPPILPLKVIWERLRALGYEIPDDATLESMVVEQQAAMAALEAQATVDQVDEELQTAQDELAGQE